VARISQKTEWTGFMISYTNRVSVEHVVGSMRVPRFLGEMISCLSVSIHHYEYF